MLAVPIRWQEQALGVLEATHTDPDAFDEDSLQALETAANWMAIAIGNARQRAELERRVQESEAMAKIGRALDETLELE